MKQCFECRNGEHDNLDDDVRMTTILDPDTGRLVGRGYLCGEHTVAKLDDGFNIRRVR